MPKILFIGRHADASSTAAGKTDYERVLSPTGMQQSREAAKWLATQPAPYLVCSAATRAYTTALAFAQAWPHVQPLAIETLYEASGTDLLRFICQLPDEADTAMLVAHNPAVSHLVMLLTGQYIGMSTCQIVKIQLEADNWAEVTGDSGTIIDGFSSRYR